jgi:hypothetical protein
MILSATHFCEGGCGAKVSANKRCCLSCLAKAWVAIAEKNGTTLSFEEALAAVKQQLHG